MPHEIDSRPTAIEDVRALFEYLAVVGQRQNPWQIR